MTNLSAKIFEVFRNLRSDAVPRSPRPQNIDPSSDVNEENVQDDNDLDDSNNQEYVETEPDENLKQDDKAKGKKTFFGYKKKHYEFSSAGKEKKKNHSNNSVNTQATGNVINIVDSQNVRWGNEFVYYLGPTNGPQTPPNESECDVEKCNLVTLLMESKIKPDHEFVDYISKNLGKNWHSFFRTLGYTKGRIETFEIDEARNGVSEARYKLLLDWIRNDDDGTLGRLATLLWEEGERQIVKELALIYKKNKQ